MDTLNESLEMFYKYVENLPKACSYISNLIKEDNISEAFNLILNFTEGVDWIVQMNRLLVNERAIHPIEIEKLQLFLSEITEGLQVQDYIVIADLFEYEIVPFFEAYLNEGGRN